MGDPNTFVSGTMRPVTIKFETKRADQPTDHQGEAQRLYDLLANTIPSGTWAHLQRKFRED